MARAHKGIRQPAPPPSGANANEIAAELADELEDGTMASETAEELGAVNAEAVRANRRRETVVAQKRGGEKRVPWGEENACLMYDSIIQLYAPTSLAIQVQRLTGGAPATWYLQSQPSSGRELYEHIGNTCHGRAGESSYKVTVVDAATQYFRGVGRITFPSTIGMQGQAQPVAQAPPMQPPMWGQQPMPQPFFQPPAGVPAAVVAAPMTAAPAHAGPDLAQALALQRQLSEMQAVLSQLLGRPAAAAPPAAPAAAPPGPAQLPFAIPPGHVLVMGANGQQMIVPASQIGFQGAPAAAAAAPQPPPPPMTPAQQFASSIGMIRQAMGAANEIKAILPDAAAAAQPAAPEKPTDEEYIKATKVGEINILQNRDDGSFLPFETLLANGDKVMQWVREQSAILQGKAPPPGTPGAPAQQSNGQAPVGVGAMSPPSIPVHGP